jgi:hypothetical protein
MHACHYVLVHDIILSKKRMDHWTIMKGNQFISLIRQCNTSSLYSINNSLFLDAQQFPTMFIDIRNSMQTRPAELVPEI